MSHLRGLPVVEPAAPPLLAVRDLRVLRGGRPVLEKVTAEITRGQITVVVGLNGSGKSTLLRTLLGEFPHTPPSCREIVHHIFGQRAHRVRIKNSDVRRQARMEQAAVIDTKGRRRFSGQPAHGLFQRHHLLFSYPVSQEHRTVAISTVELHVCPAVGKPHNGFGVVEYLGHDLFVHIARGVPDDGRAHA